MASDYLLEIDGIKGESTDEKHKETIEISSFSLGASQTGAFAAGSGGGTGKVSLVSFNFIAKTSKASPLLFLNTVQGKHLTKAVFYGRKSGEKQPVEYLKFTLTDVLVSSYGISDETGGDPPLDQFSLNFAKIEFSYTPTDAGGATGPPVVATWDVKSSKGGRSPDEG